MKVESILRSKGTHVVTTRPDATIATVVGAYKREGIGALVKSVLHDLRLEANVLRDVYRATQSRLMGPENHARP